MPLDAFPLLPLFEYKASTLFVSPHYPPMFALFALMRHKGYTAKRNTRLYERSSDVRAQNNYFFAIKYQRLIV